jgi:hypothetical protein
MLFNSQFLMIILYTRTTKPYPTKWGWLHESNGAIVFYQKWCSGPCSFDTVLELYSALLLGNDLALTLLRIFDSYQIDWTKFYVCCPSLTQPSPFTKAWDRRWIAKLNIGRIKIARRGWTSTLWLTATCSNQLCYFSLFMIIILYGS